MSVALAERPGTGISQLHPTMRIYVSKNGQRYGPYSMEELRKEVRANVFQPGHFASSDEGRSWTRLDELPGMNSFACDVETDAERNLLVIRYHGRVGPEEVKRCAGEVAAVLPKLAPNFRLLVDFTDLKSMETTCASHLKTIMKLCDENGVSAVVRIIPDPRRDIGLQIMSYFHYAPEVHIVTCKSPEEAAEILAAETDDGKTAAPQQ
jgi:anti-anti-sigma regulatory factor